MLLLRYAAFTLRRVDDILPLCLLIDYHYAAIDYAAADTLLSLRFRQRFTPPPVFAYIAIFSSSSSDAYFLHAAMLLRAAAYFSPVRSPFCHCLLLIIIVLFSPLRAFFIRRFSLMLLLIDYAPRAIFLLY